MMTKKTMMLKRTRNHKEEKKMKSSVISRKALKGQSNKFN